MSGIIGRKEFVGGTLSQVLKAGAQLLYGGKYYQINFEILMANGMLHAFASTFVGGMYDLFGGYVLPLFILAGCGVIGIVASFCVKKP